MIVSEIPAKQVFRKGDKVMIALKGLIAGVWEDVEQPITGVVSSLRNQSSHCMVVRLKGHKRGESYAWWLWERAA